MDNNIRAYGRMELANAYFPYMSGKCAWQKLKHWMSINSDLRPLLSMNRRTFTPQEVGLIFHILGEP